MKILGIGNAIVDGICKVEDSFLSNSNLTNSTMKLVDETENSNKLVWEFRAYWNPRQR